jgi:hypothetical protein
MHRHQRRRRGRRILTPVALLTTLGGLLVPAYAQEASGEETFPVYLPRVVDLIPKVDPAEVRVECEDPGGGTT